VYKKMIDFCKSYRRNRQAPELFSRLLSLMRWCFGETGRTGAIEKERSTHTASEQRAASERWEAGRQGGRQAGRQAGGQAGWRAGVSRQLLDRPTDRPTVSAVLSTGGEVR
jgi:hypothetical protein